MKSRIYSWQQELGKERRRLTEQEKLRQELARTITSEGREPDVLHGEDQETHAPATGRVEQTPEGGRQPVRHA